MSINLNKHFFLMPPLDVEFIDIDCLVNCIDWLLALLINVNVKIGLSLVLVRGMFANTHGTS